MDWRKILRDCAKDTVLNVGFWVKEAVIVLAGLSFLRSLAGPALVRVPFLTIGGG